MQQLLTEGSKALTHVPLKLHVKACPVPLTPSAVGLLVSLLSPEITGVNLNLGKEIFVVRGDALCGGLWEASQFPLDLVEKTLGSAPPGTPTPPALLCPATSSCKDASGASAWESCRTPDPDSCPWGVE